jgi:hypothetical protein
MHGYEKEYRGYTLRAKRDGQAWRVAASPKSPDLPLLLPRRVWETSLSPVRAGLLLFTQESMIVLEVAPSHLLHSRQEASVGTLSGVPPAGASFFGTSEPSGKLAASQYEGLLFLCLVRASVTPNVGRGFP